MIAASGQHRACFSCLHERGLKALLRSRAPGEEIAELLPVVVWKLEIRRRINQPDPVKHARFMTVIAG